MASKELPRRQDVWHAVGHKRRLPPGSTLHLVQSGPANRVDGLEARAWDGVDIRAETRKKALERGKGRSIHEALETELREVTRHARHRWIVCNDGAGEMADYITVTIAGGQVGVGLWHAKFAGGERGVRVGDLQEVVAQGIKSRRWITSPSGNALARAWPAARHPQRQ